MGVWAMVKIIADSVNIATGDRITTYLIKVWKVLQAELRTHRSTGQSHYSSRAIPTEKLIKQVMDNPFIPLWREYQKGMAGSDTLSEGTKKEAGVIWRSAIRSAIWHVNQLKDLGIAKEQRNRLLEPFMSGDCVITASDYAWEHFFKLRCADGVQPEFKELAEEMLAQYRKSTPNNLIPGEWHIAFSNEDLSFNDRITASVASCARTSYLNHEKTVDIEKDILLYNRLIADRHLTPFEHQLQAQNSSEMFAQYRGFRSLRRFVEFD